MNNASKAPVVGPGSAAGYANEKASAQMSYFQALALAQAQKGLVRGQFKMDRAAAKGAEVTNMADAQNAQLDSGTFGSSMDFEARSGVKAQLAAELAAAKQTKATGLLSVQQDKLTAQNAYYTSLFDIAARKRAEQADMAAQQLMQDMVLRMNDERGGASTGGGGGGGGTGGGGGGRIGIGARGPSGNIGIGARGPSHDKIGIGGGLGFGIGRADSGSRRYQ